MTGWLPDSWRLCDTPDVSSEDRCGQCGKTIPKCSVSAYFCGITCQTLWQKKQGDPIPWTGPMPANDEALAQSIRNRWGLPGPELDGVA